MPRATIKRGMQNGQQRVITHMYIRGSKIRFIIVPDMMKNAPMFKRVDPKYKDKLPAMGQSGYARKNHVRRER
jgi:small nuclear ribonucleoprotein D3